MSGARPAGKEINFNRILSSTVGHHTPVTTADRDTTEAIWFRLATLNVVNRGWTRPST